MNADDVNIPEQWQKSAIELAKECEQLKQDNAQLTKERSCDKSWAEIKVLRKELAREISEQCKLAAIVDRYKGELARAEADRKEADANATKLEDALLSEYSALEILVRFGFDFTDDGQTREVAK